MKTICLLLAAVILTACNLPAVITPAPVAATEQPVAAVTVEPTVFMPTATPVPTATPTATATPLPSPTPTDPGPYTVQSGDTLSGIADRYGVGLDALAYINNILNQDDIYAGQVLVIPPLDLVVPTPDPDKVVNKLILVVLDEQKVYVYGNGELLKEFVVSSGTSKHPTVTGTYQIYVKLEWTTMSGPGYYLENVPHTMYFFKGYGLHGTYWHNNFGTPMSHGCVNLSLPDAETLYDWAEVGTTVRIVQSRDDL